MLDDFIVRAALAALGTALAAGALGCFVVWRRMAYFGDATAHAAVLGVAVALGFDLSVTVGVAAVALAMALALHALTRADQGADTLLGVLSHGGLAAGIVAAALVPGARIDLDAWLFGDVLAVSLADLAVIWGGAALVLAVLAARWSQLLTATVSPELAHAAGQDPRRAQLLLTVLLAVVVAVAIRITGALLITALLIVPAATARQFARTPEGMAAASVALAAASALGGVQIALWVDTPVGPSIVCLAVTLFGLATFGRGLTKTGA